MSWNSRLHPRDPRTGRFIDTPGGSSGSSDWDRYWAKADRASGNRTKVGVSTPVTSALTGSDPYNIPAKNSKAGKLGRVGPVRVTLRANTRSVTGAVGKDIRLSPSYNVHIAALARIERTSDKKSYLKKLETKILMRLAEYLPTNRLQNYAADLILNRRTNVGGASVGLKGGGYRAPTLSVGRNVGGAKRQLSGAPASVGQVGAIKGPAQATAGQKLPRATRTTGRTRLAATQRSPNRKPRYRSATQGRRVR